MESKTSGLMKGMSATASIQVEEKNLASTVGSGEASVFATPMLVAGIEQAASAVVRPFLSPGETSVGIHIDIYHRAASPPGSIITFEATLTDISPNGKGLGFNVRAWDEGGVIGDGTHERVIVEKDKFEARAMMRGNRQS